mmetsp:Transcript_1457/g.8926  ORF Transcript_1457/g.8926 Transcript_1457/m.8926 type:complete len:84 (-) Transcript_1457:1183-1434(-)
MHGLRERAKAQSIRIRENLGAKATSPRRPSFDHVATAEGKIMLCFLSLFIAHHKRKLLLFWILQVCRSMSRMCTLLERMKHVG